MTLLNSTFSKIVVLTIAALSVLSSAACARPIYIAGGALKPAPVFSGDSACDTKFDSGECVSVGWEKLPTETDFGSFVFKIYRLNAFDKSPIVVDTSGTLTVRLFMPSMGHGSSPVTVSKIDTGTYRAANVYFSMPGDWQIIFEVKKNNQVVSTAVLSYKF